ncbi:MAG: energy transducer TonB [Bacteroidaceae bacterium]|nr:energy transducer TonB [Bacteroidaceae bacterium]
MAKLDIYDPKWVDMVFANKNKSYGAYQLRMGTSGRNMKAIIILLVAALLTGGYLVYKIKAQQAEEERLAYMEAQELAKLREQAKKKEDQPKIPPKVEPKKEIPEVRESQKFTAPVIKKDELVKEENVVKQMDKLDENVAVSTKDQEGVKDRTVEAVRNDIAVNTEPKQEVKQEVATKVFDAVEQMPSFPGGQGALLSFLSSNVKYPAVAEQNNIQGKAIVGFIVEPNGSVTGVHIMRSAGDPSLDTEAMRVVGSMPRWNPGKQNGQAVRVKYQVPITFRLQ